MKPIAIALSLAAIAGPVGPTMPSVPAAATTDAATRLRALFHDSDEAMLRRHPIEALGRGNLRYADRLGEFFVDANADGDRRAAEADLAALATIDPARLGRIDRLAYDVFADRQRRALRGLAPGIVAIDRVLPIDHFNGIQTWYPDFASGKGTAPFATVLDYDNNLKRNAQYAAALDRAIGRFRQGMAGGVVQPRFVVTDMIEEFDALLADSVERTPFYQPVTMFPAAVAAGERARLTAAYAAQVRDVIQPAHRRMRDFLATTYLPAARTTIGLGALPGGAAYYRDALEQATTLDLAPDALHQLGLDELGRDQAELETLKAKVGFTGTLPQFYAFLRTDPSFRPASSEDVRARYAAIARRVDARVREQFSLVPRTPIELRPVPAVAEKRAAPGSYRSGTADGSRPGIFYYNSYDLPARSTWLMEDLYLHEAVPGHHFQISLAQENDALPAFMRYGGDTAYVEGWGLYAEGLGLDLGMYADPYARIGRLYGDIVRAARLVVDTGIHAQGWTRERAIDFMLANVPVSRTAAVAEVERYVASPGQATAYKVGQITILRLKAKARAALGTKFDPRAFHAAVLDTGALPLTVLERKLDAWIAAGGVAAKG